MPERIARRVGRAIRERVFPGCVVGFVSRTGERAVLPFGSLAYHRDGTVAGDTLYDVASVTKSIPVAALASILMSDGTLTLEKPVRDYIPELQNDLGATIEDLLRYRVQGARMSTLQDLSHERIRARIFERGFRELSGKSLYTNVPAFVLGIAIERASGVALDVLAQERVFTPHGMHNTFFPIGNIYINILIHCAPTEVVDGIEVCGIVHDESARVFARGGVAVGHAGLFSSAPDLLGLSSALLDPHDGLTKSVIEAAENGLGWDVSEPWMGRFRGAKTCGKTGFTGTSVLVDREKGIGLVILSNRTYPRRPESPAAINAFRADIADIVLS